MAYEESSFRRRSVGEDSGDRTGTFAPSDYRARRRDTSAMSVGEFTEAVPRRHDEARDRMGVHVGWEIILLFGVGVMGFVLRSADPEALKRPTLNTLLITGTALGLLALAAGISLRAAVPNLAIGPVTIAAALHFAENSDKGVVPVIVQAGAVAAVGGAAIGLVIVIFHVPGWAATLGGALGVVTYDLMRTAPVRVQGRFDPTGKATLYFAGFAVLAVLGGLIGAAPGVRRWLGSMRPHGDPARRQGAAVVLPVVLALVLSSVMAVLAGVLLASIAGGQVQPTTGLEWTGLGLGTALVAGTSAYGRRGGIFGTLLATAILTMFIEYQNHKRLDISTFAIGAVAIGVGLVVTRLVETYGRRLSLGPDDDWAALSGAGTSWPSERQVAWPPGGPTERARGGANRWSDDQ
jgi:ribose/xylose/arabinose/galactoside ABC-type transport system permease subunit